LQSSSTFTGAAASTSSASPIPGLELTFNDPEPVLAAHAVALGLREFVSVDDGIAEAMRSAAEAAPRSSRRTRTPTSPRRSADA